MMENSACVIYRFSCLGAILQAFRRHCEICSLLFPITDCTCKGLQPFEYGGTGGAFHQDLRPASILHLTKASFSNG